ncbi:MAG: class I SAM-dependent methyltransferase [Gemmatimonadales bacterium]
MMKLRRLAKSAAAFLPPGAERRIKSVLAARRDSGVIDALSQMGPTGALENAACEICGGTITAPHLTKHGFRIVRCVNDGLLFVSPRPADLSPYYNSRYYTGGVPGVYRSYDEHATDMRLKWESRLAELSKASGGNGRLLDVGAASGQFLALAIANGWDGMGIDLSEWAAEKARRVHHVNVVAGTLPDSRVPESSFDAATMWDCIEHLAEPRKVLEAVRRTLRPDGILALTTGALAHCDPRAVSGWYYPPWHLFYFARETVTALLNVAGFEVTAYSVDDKRSPFAVMTVIARATPGS